MTSEKSSGKDPRRVLSLLTIAVVALSTLSLAIYLQLRDTASSLDYCRELLISTRGDLESLGRYAQGLYMNYTRLYEFAKSLVANYTVLQEAYHAVNQRYELTAKMLEANQKLYEELYESYKELKANYSKVMGQLEAFDEVVGLAKELRMLYLTSQVLGFDYINASLVAVLSNSSYAIRLVRSWTRTLFSDFRPTVVSVPTPEPGYLIIRYNNTRGVCFTVTVSNAYVVPERYVTSDTYYRTRTCLTRGEIVVPVLPHHTTLEVEIPPISDGTTFRLAEVVFQFQYATFKDGSLGTSE